ncbi:hypothetical protein E1301_Tti022130 [Triplophysa tibetana]|uniref:Uncharacterized protein n=1 Tax=Triplophysa tibetana TaxID=1572043 RepID=A0A5A9MZR7_9TELE|nr:hypothetical protein E1301_Tti022130 [Triplophysa tibetana]
MSRTVEVVIGSPVHLDQSSGSSPVYVTETKPGDPPGVRGFLKVNPDALGWLQILAGAVVFGAVYWNYESWLLIPACFLILTGVITTTAACTRNPCLVVTSQVLNLINIFSTTAVLLVFLLLFYIILTIRVFLYRSLNSIDVTFIVCNVLALVFSLIIFATSCCWCKSRKRLMIIHMNSVPPAVVSDVVDHVVPIPPAYSPVPSSEPPAYEYERQPSVSEPSAPVWDMQRWKDELHRSRKPIQV